MSVEWQDYEIPVSASFGFEGYHTGSQADALLFLADRALYRHKEPRLVLSVDNETLPAGRHGAMAQVHGG